MDPTSISVPTNASAAGGLGAVPLEPATGSSAPVINVTDASFATDVVERSRTTPVVLDFWAEWCGPCKQLSPVLEKLASEAQGRWLLAKIDVDANPGLAQSFRIQSIPAVHAVVGGQLVQGFVGVLPETQIRQWLTQMLKLAGGDAEEVPPDPAFDEAEAALTRGDLDGARKAFASILERDPANAEAKSGLATTDLLGRAQSYDEAALRQRAQTNPADIDAVLAVADLDVLHDDAEAAFGRLLTLIRNTTGDERDKVRLHLISLFDVLPADDPRALRARRDLASALF